jgi:hypothetical protein
MWKHFKHLHFKTFQLYHGGPIWCLFAFSTKAQNIWDFGMNVTPKVGVHMEVIGFNLLHSPSLVKVFHS